MNVAEIVSIWAALAVIYLVVTAPDVDDIGDALYDNEVWKFVWWLKEHDLGITWLNWWAYRKDTGATLTYGKAKIGQALHRGRL